MRYLLTTASELTDGLQTELAEVTEHISRTQEYLDRYLPAVISFGLRLVLAVVAVFTAAANPMVYLTGNSTMVAFLMLLVALAGAVITVIASYFFYTALDDLAVVRGYDYPAGRIKWCFWLSIIIAVASAVLELAMPGAARIGSLVLQVVILVLLWQYLQAVRRSEQGE